MEDCIATPIATHWRLRSRVMEFGRRPRIMGILNVTPDSFSDGGQCEKIDDAVQRGLQMVAHGADIIDVGGESTRPYSVPVSSRVELARVIPVIEQLARATTVPISVDTSKAEVAQAALDAGAEIVNDVTGLAGDPDMISVVREAGAAVCAMHMQGTPQTMQDHPHYEDVVNEIGTYLVERLRALTAAGIDPQRICLDPGIGFGKTHEHNWTLIRRCAQFLRLGQPILVGHSRKGFIGKAVQSESVVDRDIGTLAISLFLARKRIQIVRVHNVLMTSAAFAVLGHLGETDDTTH